MMNIHFLFYYLRPSRADVCEQGKHMIKFSLKKQEMNALVEASVKQRCQFENFSQQAVVHGLS